MIKDKKNIQARKVLWVAGLLLATLLPSAAQAQAVNRGPYLQQGTPTSVVVRWRTSTSTDSQVRYGTQLGNLGLTASVAGPRTEHVATVSGLQADTQYFYSVGNAAGPLAGGDSEHTFRTSPPSGTAKATRIWVLGDSGTANVNAQAVREAFFDFTGTRVPDLWLMLGDNAYNDGMDAEYQAAVFEMYPTVLRKSVLWPTIGNHDARTSGVYFNIFTLPTNGEAGGRASATENYYSFDYGNIHFVVLDSQLSSRLRTGAMLTWLQDDLGANTLPWTIAFFHHPPYSKGSHDSDRLAEVQMIEMRQNALPILEAGGVDLVITGVASTDIFDTSARIVWSTDKAADSLVDYGLTTAYGLQASDPSLAMSHSLSLAGLTPDTTYHYRVTSADISAQATSSGDFTFTTLSVNDPPVADDQSVVTVESTAVAITLTAGDVEGDPLTFLVVTQPTAGVLSGTPPDLTYSPNFGFLGADSFTFQADDGLAASNPATVSVDVVPRTPIEQNLQGGNKIEVNQGLQGAQSFGHGAAGDPDYRISRVVLHLSRDLDPPDGDLTFSIGTAANAGAIPGSVVAISPAQVTNASEGVSFETIEVQFGTPVGPLTAGTTYFLSFEAESPNGKKYYHEYAGASTYAGGTYFKSGSNDGKDIWFQIWDGESAPPPQFTLTAGTVGQGSVALDPAGGVYDAGTAVTVTATPAAGWQFDDWSGDLAGSQNPAILTMDTPKSVSANFSFIPVGEQLLTENGAGGDKMEVNQGQTGAQSFSVGSTGDPDFQITKVVLHLSRDSEVPDLDLAFSIGTGLQTGTLAGSVASITPAGVTDTSAGVTFDAFEVTFAAPVGPLSAGTTYFLNLEAECPNGAKYYLEYDAHSLYAAGTYFKNSSDDGKDLRFQVWGASTP